jgi:hypothetical protein
MGQVTLVNMTGVVGLVTLLSLFSSCCCVEEVLIDYLQVRSCITKE